MPTGGTAAANNPLTAKGRDALMRAFDELGGVDGLVTWGKKNRGTFYKLFFRAMPREREANALGSGIVINVGTTDTMRPVIDVTPGDEE